MRIFKQKVTCILAGSDNWSNIHMALMSTTQQHSPVVIKTCKFFNLDMQATTNVFEKYYESYKTITSGIYFENK